MAAIIGKLARTFVNKKIQGFIYDFSRNGGLQGSYQTGIIIPFECIFVSAVYTYITPLAGGIGSAFNIGWDGNLTALDMQALPQPVNLVVPLSDSSIGLEILFTITTNDFTAGKMVVALEYIEEPIN